MREKFIPLEGLARKWMTEERLIHEAADRAGILLFTLQGRSHADELDLERLGEALSRDAKAVT
jgi:hypothetical protein